MKKVVKIIICVLLTLIVIAAVGISVFTGDQVVRNSTKLTQADEDFVIPYNVFTSYHMDYEAFASRYRDERLSLTSSQKDAHEIPADYLFTEGSEDKNHDTVIMVHGLGGNRMSIYPVAQVFLKNGWNVLAYDQRSSGENHAEGNTFGYLEKFDLLDWAKQIREWAPDKRLGIWGTSFGGLTSVLAVCDSSLGLTQQTAFMVLDCPLSNMEDELRLVMNSEDMGGIPTDYLIWTGNIMNKLELGFTYSEADGRAVIRDRMKQSVPLLIFTSGKDELAPYPMGADMFELYPGENKTLINFEDSEHVDGWKDHEAEYREAVEKLLASIE